MFSYELRSFIDYHPTSIMPKMSTPMQWAVLSNLSPVIFIENRLEPVQEG